MVEQKVKFFASKHSAKDKKRIISLFRNRVLSFTVRILRASWLQSLCRKLNRWKKYRYLTTPNGNPSNFSYVWTDGEYEIRQQVRIKSHIDDEIAFTPDIIVLFRNSEMSSIKRVDYASGRRPFYTVSSKSVVAAHECKSTNPFPELLVSFMNLSQ
jgi:hypothetical protein